MPGSILVVRLILGVLAVGFAFQLGQSYMRFRKGRAKPSSCVAWAFRTVAALAGVLWPFRRDAVAIAAVSAVVVAAGVGVYLEWRPKHEDEDLTEVMFPKDNGR